MLFIYLLLFSRAWAFDNEKCDVIVKLDDREVATLLSPNHPDMEPAESSCRWTVVAENNRRIIFVCPFYHLLTKTKISKDCGNIFKVQPDADSATYGRYCQDQGFYEISVNNRMIITYENNSEKPADNFTCYLYAELKSNWNQAENYTAPLHYNYNITLGGNEMAQLVSPSYPDYDKTPSNMQWLVTAPSDYKITLACPFMDQPPEPLTLQLAPCHGRFTVKTDAGNFEYRCEQKTFSHSHTGNSMTVLYENRMGPPDDGFVCFVYSEPTAKPKDEVSALPYEHCDHVLTLANTENGIIQSPNYPNDTMPHATCRWTVISPKSSQIEIQGIEPQESRCNGRFHFETVEATATKDCIGVDFIRTRLENWAIITFENPFDYPVQGFEIRLKAIGVEPVEECSNCSVTGAFGNADCDLVILLHSGEVRQLASPNYFSGKREPGHSTCRYTVVAPTDNRVVLVCYFYDSPGTENIQPPDCRGQFTVLTEGRNTTMHCNERTFSRTSVNNRMVIMYENQLNEAIEPFLCDLYAEEKSESDQNNPNLQNLTLFDECEYEMQLEKSGMDIFTSPYYPESEPALSTCRWTVLSPPGIRIILSCPFSEDTYVTQSNKDNVTCPVHLLISTEGRPNSTYCIGTPFIRTSDSNKMLIKYENLSQKRAKKFKCYLRGEYLSPGNECDNCKVTGVLPYEKCDNVYNLTYGGMVEMKLPTEDVPGSSCRWTLVSPSDSRILVSCPFNKETVTNYCSSYFKVLKAGKELWFCRATDFEQFATNWTIVTYDNPSIVSFIPFTCRAYVEKKIYHENCINCTDLETLDFSRCTYNMQINETGKILFLKSPNYPYELQRGVPCRWNLRSPIHSYISLKCGNLKDDSVEDFCSGYFAVYPDGPNQDPVILCRHTAFTMKSSDNEMIMTYGHQFGVSNKAFKCTVIAVDTLCRHSIQLGRLRYDQSFEVSLPYWDTKLPLWPFCYWSIESPKDTQLVVYCDMGKDKEKALRVYPTDQEWQYYETPGFPKYAHFNKMGIKYNITRYNRPRQPIGCRVYTETYPRLGPECDCGDKFNQFQRYKLYDRRRVFSIKDAGSKYSMLAFIGKQTILTFYFVCAATIISKKYALTAGHCLEDVTTSLVASHYLYHSADHVKSVGGGPFMYRPIVYTKVHKLFVKGDVYFDIGIVGVSASFIDVLPACLPFYNRKRSYVNETIISLGLKPVFSFKIPIDLLDFRLYDFRSYVLLQINGTIDSDANCKDNFGEYVAHQHTCSNYKEPTQCTLFDGGPVLWRDSHGKLKLIGINIKDKNCASKRNHIQAISIKYFLSWIEKEIPDVSFCKAE